MEFENFKFFYKKEISDFLNYDFEKLFFYQKKILNFDIKNFITISKFFKIIKLFFLILFKIFFFIKNEKIQKIFLKKEKNFLNFYIFFIYNKIVILRNLNKIRKNDIDIFEIFMRWYKILKKIIKKKNFDFFFENLKNLLNENLSEKEIFFILEIKKILKKFEKKNFCNKEYILSILKYFKILYKKKKFSKIISFYKKELKFHDFTKNEKNEKILIFIIKSFSKKKEDNFEGKILCEKLIGNLEILKISNIIGLRFLLKFSDEKKKKKILEKINLVLNNKNLKNLENSNKIIFEKFYFKISIFIKNFFFYNFNEENLSIFFFCLERCIKISGKYLIKAFSIYFLKIEKLIKNFKISKKNFILEIIENKKLFLFDLKSEILFLNFDLIFSRFFHNCEFFEKLIIICFSKLLNDFPEEMLWNFSSLLNYYENKKNENFENFQNPKKNFFKKIFENLKPSIKKYIIDSLTIIKKIKNLFKKMNEIYNLQDIRNFGKEKLDKKIKFHIKEINSFLKKNKNIKILLPIIENLRPKFFLDENFQISKIFEKKKTYIKKIGKVIKKFKSMAAPLLISIINSEKIEIKFI